MGSSPLYPSTRLLLLLSRLCILIPTSSLSFPCSLPSFPCSQGHLSLLTSYKFLALILLSVLALSMQLPQLFGTPFRTFPDSVRSSDTVNSFRQHLKHIFSKQLSTAPSDKPHRLRLVVLMSRRRRAGCFFTGAPTSCDRRRGSTGAEC